MACILFVVLTSAETQPGLAYSEIPQGVDGRGIEQRCGELERWIPVEPVLGLIPPDRVFFCEFVQPPTGLLHNISETSCDKRYTLEIAHPSEQEDILGVEVSEDGEENVKGEQIQLWPRSG